MALAASFPSRPNPGRRYLREPVCLHFPASEEVPETGVHMELRALLYFILRRELAGRAFVGSDQFVYWDPINPRRCLAPGTIVRVGADDAPRRIIKVWEEGAPHLAVEFVSASDVQPRKWAEKLEDYRSTGIAEVVRFDVENDAIPLRIWDHVEGDLVERDLVDENARRCDCLGLFWCVRPDQRLGRALRLSRDAAGKDLLLTADEALVQHERRIQELEAELARRR